MNPTQVLAWGEQLRDAFSVINPGHVLDLAQPVILGALPVLIVLGLAPSFAMGIIARLRSLF